MAFIVRSQLFAKSGGSVTLKLICKLFNIMKMVFVSKRGEHVSGILVRAANFWERKGRMTAKLITPEKTTIVGLGDKLEIGQFRGEVIEFKKNQQGQSGLVLGLEVTGDETTVKPALKPQRLELSQFSEEDKVTRIPPSATLTLAGFRLGISNYGLREDRLSAVLMLRTRKQVLYVGDEFDVGLCRFELIGIQRTESGGDWEAYLKEIGSAHDPQCPLEEERVLLEFKRASEQRKKEVEDDMITVPEQLYAFVMDRLSSLSGDILFKMDAQKRSLDINHWEERRSEKMNINPREGDLGPDVTVIKTAQIEREDVAVSSKVVTTQWGPGAVANIHATFRWSIGEESLYCSLLVDKEGKFTKAYVTGEETSRALVCHILKNLR